MKRMLLFKEAETGGRCGVDIDRIIAVIPIQDTQFVEGESKVNRKTLIRLEGDVSVVSSDFSEHVLATIDKSLKEWNRHREN